MVLTTSPATALVIHTDAVVLLGPVDIPSLRDTVELLSPVDTPSLRDAVDTPSPRGPMEIPSLRGPVDIRRLLPVDMPSLHGLLRISSLTRIALVTHMVSMRILPVSIVSTVSANLVVSIAALVPIPAAS